MCFGPLCSPLCILQDSSCCFCVPVTVIHTHAIRWGGVSKSISSSFPSPYSSHHSSTSWPVFHLSIWICYRTVKNCFHIFAQLLIWSICFHLSCAEPSVFTQIKASLDYWVWHRSTYLLEEFFIFPSVVKVFFFIGKRNTSDIDYRCTLLCSWAHKCVLLAFWRMYQTAYLLLLSLLSLFAFQPNNSWIHITLENNSRPLLCLLTFSTVAILLIWMLISSH